MSTLEFSITYRIPLDNGDYECDSLILPISIKRAVYVLFMAQCYKLANENGYKPFPVFSVLCHVRDYYPLRITVLNPEQINKRNVQSQLVNLQVNLFKFLFK